MLQPTEGRRLRMKKEQEHTFNYLGLGFYTLLKGTREREDKRSSDKGHMCGPEWVTCDQGGSHVTLFSHTCDFLK